MSEIKPALPEREWAFTHQLVVGEHLSGKLGRDGRLIVAFPRRGHLDTEAYCADDIRHALAALCLHDQPFGFTREDVDLVSCEAMNSQDNGNPTEAGMFQSLADRIEALLPPEDIHATQEEQPSGEQEHQQVR